jgi:hypothetical protein
VKRTPLVKARPRVVQALVEDVADCLRRQTKEHGAQNIDVFAAAVRVVFACGRYILEHTRPEHLEQNRLLIAEPLSKVTQQLAGVTSTTTRH